MSDAHPQPHGKVKATGEPVTRFGDFYLFRDGAGEMYLLPADVLEDWRVPPDLYADLDQIVANPEVSGFAYVSPSSLQATLYRMELAAAQADAAAKATQSHRQAALNNISRLLDIMRGMNPQI